MTDLSRSITYAGFDLNNALAQVGKPGLIGCSVEVMDISPVAVEQYIDKTAWNEGMDFQGVGNLNVGSRAVSLRGTLFGQTRGDLWDRLVPLRTALDPVQSYALDEANGGFLPLAWSEPTGSSGGVVNRFVNARPHDFRYVMNRDKQGTSAKVAGKEDDVALALQWSCQFLARDPRVYGSTTTVDVHAHPTGSLVNHGDYPTLIDIELALDDNSGDIAIAAAGADFRFTIEPGTSGRVVRYTGLTRLLTLEDPAYSSEQILRQDVLSFSTVNSDTQHPSLLPGSSPYSFVASGGLTMLAGALVYTDAYS